MNMRILFIIASSNFGGTENHLLNLIKGLTKAGLTVGIVCPDNGIFTEELDNIYYINIKDGGFFSSIKHILNVIKEFKPHIIHSHLTRASYIGFFLRALYKIPVAATVHNVLGRCKYIDLNSRFLFPKNTDLAFKLLTVFGGRLIAVSNYIKDALIADGVNAKNIDVIWNGTHFADMPVPIRNNEFRRQYNIAESDIVIGVIGSVKKGKGQILAVEAISLMPEELRSNIKLVMIGSFNNDEYKQAIDNLAIEKNIQNNVIFAGINTNMREVYADIDIVLHPSYSEACSMAIIESMSTAKPIIVSNIPANSSIIDDKVNGCLVELNPSDIKATLLNLILNNDLRSTLSANARSKAESNYSLTKMTSDYIDFYNNVGAQ